ncbi:unannotated protein [freshwater metagenome]|uniref:Unannotated protein n=1 Tax=freshwater metagenome TaxID=449393 RepID=A0A6J7ULA1_9ZZZZ
MMTHRKYDEKISLPLKTVNLRNEIAKITRAIQAALNEVEKPSHKICCTMFGTDIITRIATFAKMTANQLTVFINLIATTPTSCT